MTAATVTERLETNDPTVEVVIVTASDNETYVSKKFGSVSAVSATLMEDAGLLSVPVSCSISSATVTMHCSGTSTVLDDKKVCLVLYGRK